MLVITRKAGQRVFIGPDIEVTVGKLLPDGKVRLCIQAPRATKIVREELVTKGAAR